MSVRAAKSNNSTTLPARRQWLARMSALASVAAVPLWLPRARANSQTVFGNVPGTALVIGNSAYLPAPLGNPVNDARAIGSELQKLGFSVSVQLDAGRMQLIEAIRQFSSELAANKGVGVFYFAGHGAQLASRNYLVPVDAAIRRPADLHDKAVELNSLLQALGAARNQTNIVILDACRENSLDSELTGQGLSQYDAPPGTLLAYAATPGKTAPDSIGRNGLYVRALLRELALPAASVEDVFKRVRLAVRLQSEGRQVPWQSAALEHDFTFRAPEQSAGLTREESERQFEAELAVWQKVEFSKNPASLAYYLRRYPSGMFSELAQFRLESLFVNNRQSFIRAAWTAPAAAAIAPNPFSKGTFLADARYAVGDSYSYRAIDVFSRAPGRHFTETVTAITNSNVVFNDGSKVIDFLGNDVKSDLAVFASPVQFLPAEYAIGKKWTTRFERKSHFNPLSSDIVALNFSIKAKETISVPAGTFDAFKIEGQGITSSGEHWQSRFWVAPEISRRPLASELILEAGGRHLMTERHELIDFRERNTPAAERNRVGQHMTARLNVCNRSLARIGSCYSTS
ncbi:MAG: peptidase caspase catalytic subunit p20 [Betaproteobacteria bacterium]|nr:peptidase caspase catalytic subunit p20 [Betaproteobacteria bacterium]